MKETKTTNLDENKILKILIELYCKQEGIKATYKIKEVEG